MTKPVNSGQNGGNMADEQQAGNRSGNVRLVPEPFRMSSHDVAGRIGMAVNEYGTPVTVMVCASCSSLFTVTGDVRTETWGAGCLADDCDSYDVERDAGLMFDIEPWQIRRDDD